MAKLVIENPLLFAEDPHQDNPFKVLGVQRADASAQEIQFQAEEVERYAQEQLPFPETGRVERPGEAGRAARALGQPAARLAFDLLCFGLPDEERSK